MERYRLSVLVKDIERGGDIDVVIAADAQRALDVEREKVKELEAMYRQQLDERDKRIGELAESAKIWMERRNTLQAQLRQVREVLVKCRRELWHCNHQLKAKGAHEGTSVTEALRDADALIATLAAQDAGDGGVMR